MSYEQLEQVLFDPDRVSPYRSDLDMTEELVTDLTSIPDYEYENTNTNYTCILTPRKLHAPTITDPTTTCIFLDEEFLRLHPWSPRRLAFVQAYADAL